MKHIKLIIITIAGLIAMAQAQTPASAAAVPDRNLSYKSFNIGMGEEPDISSP